VRFEESSKARNKLDHQRCRTSNLQVRTALPEDFCSGMEGMLFRFALLPDNFNVIITASNMIQRLSQRRRRQFGMIALDRVVVSN